MTALFNWNQYDEPWSLTASVVLEGTDLEADVDVQARRIVLPEAGWTSAKFEFGLSTSETDPDVDAYEVYVLLSSPRTNTRTPIRLSATHDGPYTGTAVVPRATIGGMAELRGQIVTPSPVRLVGESEPWTIVVDKGAAPPKPGAPPFEAVWVDFSDADAPQVARNASDSYAVMDMTGPKPVLLLNSGVEGLDTLLMAKKPQLERNRMQKIVSSTIARYALGTLFREAQARIVRNDDEGFDPPADPFFAQVIEAVAGEVKLVEDAAALCAQLGDPGALSPEERARLWSETDNALDRLTSHSELVASAVKEVRFV